MYTTGMLGKTKEKATITRAKQILKTIVKELQSKEKGALSDTEIVKLLQKCIGKCLLVSKIVATGPDFALRQVREQLLSLEDKFENEKQLLKAKKGFENEQQLLRIALSAEVCWKLEHVFTQTFRV